MDKDFQDTGLSPNEDGSITIFSGARDTIYDAPAFGEGDRVEFATSFRVVTGSMWSPIQVIQVRW